MISIVIYKERKRV